MAKVISASAPIARMIGQQFTTATTRAATTIPQWVKEVEVYCSAACRVQFAPPIVWCGKTTDNEATFTDYTSAATDRSTDTSVDLSSLGVGSTAYDYWYVACKYPFAGIYLDIDGANGTTNTMTGYYWSGKWTSASITDGTTSGGCALAVDGPVTWSQPSGWQSVKLADLFPYCTNWKTFPEAALASPLYVMRFEMVTGANDSATTIDEVCALADATKYTPFWCQATTSYTFPINSDEVGSLEYYDSVGSKTLSVNFLYEKIPD